MKRSVWSNLVLGLWLMISPFALVFVNHHIFEVLWEDLILGFGIATFSLCRLLSRRKGEIVLADWLVTALAFLTLVNPFLYSYANAPLAKWNNLVIGGIVFILAVYQDRKDEHSMHANA
ncbi:MAG: SPW repeat domain-containing protein [Gammaproteobacteria bacterium]